MTRELRESFLKNLLGFATFVRVRERIRACADPTDDKFLEAAVNGVLVTGDRALLAMRAFRDVRIMTPTGYVAWTDNR